MDCAECKSRLVEAAEGGLADDLACELRRHLASCESCRTEFDLVERGVSVLRETIPSLAPRQAYLTSARMERLVAAHEHSSGKIFRLFSYRGFVGAAAAAAILVSVSFIAVNLGHMRAAPAEDTSPLAQMPAANDYVPVVLTATDRGEPGTALGRMSVIRNARTPWTAQPGGERPVGMDSPGVIVPVHHAFYDPEESPYWW